MLITKKSFLLFHRSLLFNPPFISFIGHTYIKDGGWKFSGEDGFNTILTFAEANGGNIGFINVI